MAEEYSSTDLKTPEEWEQIDGIIILDRDGWQGKDGRPWTDPIGRVEWCKRMARSTIRMKSFKQYQESTNLGG